MRILFFLVFLSVSALGQKESNLTRAEHFIAQSDYVAAKKYIDLAAEDSETAQLTKTWKLRGDIYMYLASQETPSTVNFKSMEDVLRFHVKAMELNNDGGMTREISKQWVLTQNVLLNKGVNLFNQHKYDEAFNCFEFGSTVAQSFGRTDSLAMYNAALASERGGNIPRALEWYSTCQSIGYRPEMCCSFSIYLLRSMDDMSAMRKKLAQCRAEFPEDQNLLITEINDRLINEDASYALAVLIEKALEHQPLSPEVLFSLGTIYGQLEEYEKSVTAYLQAIKVNPEYFDAYYNLGAHYFNLGTEYVDRNQGITDPDEFLAAQKEADELFRTALSYLEKAETLKPDDTNTLRSLQQLYARLKDTENYKRVSAKLGTD